MFFKLRWLAQIFSASRSTLSLLLVAFCSSFSTYATSRQPDSVQTGWGGAEEAKARATKGKALFEEKCHTEAGQKIYRTVPDVEGIVLLKVRPARGDQELADPLWPGAAFAREWTAGGYIETFLGFEYAPGNGLTRQAGVVTPQRRGYINTDRRPDGLPGYRYVDVLDDKDGRRYRYQGRWEEPWLKDKSYLKGYIKFHLDRALTTAPIPRYGVTFEDHVIPPHRALGVASSTIKVVDLQTKEVLGEYTRYAWSPAGPNSANPIPWATAYRCPDQAVGTGAATRKFVDQILIPRKNK